MRKRLVRLLKEETVLCAALALAVLSAFPVHPDAEYLSYIDFRTLAILFCLMGAMAGLQKTGVFQQIARALLSGVSKTRQLALILTLLCFFSAMVVTNDVALITFVPFTFTVLNLIGTEARRRLAVPIIVLQTVAANLGSMLTPIGNPQNLYLYGKANLSPGAFLQLMLPYTCVSFLLIVLWCTIQSAAYDVPVKISFCDEVQNPGNRVRPAGYLVLFALDLLTVAQIIPYQSALLITVVGLLILDRSIFFRIDYSLLLTFVGFFIFIGNMGRLPVFYEFLQRVVSGHELSAGVFASQIISNVPAALLLSGFTDNLSPLIIGVNLGGLGTLIASMASLISYKLIAREESEMKGTYFRQFTVVNISFLAVLLLFALIWE